MTELSPKIKQKNADKWLRALAQDLFPGEVVWALAGRGRMKPLTDAVAITNGRVIGFWANGRSEEQRVVLEVSADQIRGFDFPVKMGNISLVVMTDDGAISFGGIDKAETDFVQYFINYLWQHGVDPVVTEGARQAADERARQIAAEDEAERASRDLAIATQAARDSVPLFGSAMKDKWWNQADAHAQAGELPWFIVNSGSAGRLYAFEDRLVISKSGGMTGMMAGATGGGRETTFSYADITNIEYNGGFVNGVLEVLTPSYQGLGNHDFWNKDRDRDPYKLSNCLPLAKATYQQAQPKIKEMQQKILEAKRPHVIVQQVAPAVATASGGGLADELAKFADMHQRGLLDDDEFKAAKQAAIAKFS
ncbi:SHOCT domain-containing protein [Gordonia sputi]